MKVFFTLLKEIGHILAREFIPTRNHDDDEFALLSIPYEQRLIGSSNAIHRVK